MTERMAFLTEEEKQILLDCYFDIEWRDDVSDLRCVRCHRVAINHYLSSCQHLFCKICRKFYNDKDRPLKCPQCQEKIAQPGYKDFNVDVKIHQTRIVCPNKKYGCTYVDQLWKIPSHMMTCEGTPDAVSEGEMTVIDAVEDEDDVVASKIEEKLDQLEKKTENIDSKVNALTESMASVVKKIEDTNVSIQLASKKYTEELQSIKSLLESINSRIQEKESCHQQMIEKTSSNVKEKWIPSKTLPMETVQYKKHGEFNVPKTETYEFHLKDIKKTILRDKWKYESKAFRFTGNKYEIKAKFAKEEEDIGISLQFKDGDMINQHCNIIGFTRFKYIVRDQSDNLKKKDITFEQDLSFVDCFGHFDWIIVCELPDDILSPPYTKDDCIRITILFEPPSIDRNFVSNNGVLLWKVDKYKTKKEEQIYRDNWSPSFYTSPQGYRVKIRLLIHHSQSLTVEVHFLTGQHDKSLSINFPHFTTITLVNQMYPSKNLVKREQRENVDLYTIQLERVKLIEQKGFIKDDSLLLKVVMESMSTK